MHLAASQGHWKIVQVLLEAGADPNATTLEETTPLFLGNVCFLWHTCDLIVLRVVLFTMCSLSKNYTTTFFYSETKIFLMITSCFLPSRDSIWDFIVYLKLQILFVAMVVTRLLVNMLVFSFSWR